MIEDSFMQMTEFEALYRAYKKAKHGKKNKREIMEFEFNLGINLIKIQEELRNGTYKISGYRKFLVYEPREREIQTLPFRDRIIQHALCDEIMIPHIHKRLIYDNVACQEGKGTHFAVKRLTQHLCRFYRKYGLDGYFLKADIRKYFYSIDHEVVMKQMEKDFEDPRILKLIRMYIESFENTDGVGLAHGNLVSQVIALYYLNPLDRFIKEKLRIKQYIRYMDDMVLVHYDKEYLEYIKFQLDAFLEHELKLEFNEKTEIATLKDGVDFIGFHFSVTETGKIIKRLKSGAQYRLKQKLNKIRWEYRHGLTDLDSVNRKVASIQGHLKQGNTYQLRKTLFKDFTLEKLTIEKETTMIKKKASAKARKHDDIKDKKPRKRKDKRKFATSSIDELTDLLQLDENQN